VFAALAASGKWERREAGDRQSRTRTSRTRTCALALAAPKSQKYGRTVSNSFGCTIRPSIYGCQRAKKKKKKNTNNGDRTRLPLQIGMSIVYQKFNL